MVQTLDYIEGYRISLSGDYIAFVHSAVVGCFDNQMYLKRSLKKGIEEYNFIAQLYVFRCFIFFVYGSPVFYLIFYKLVPSPFVRSFMLLLALTKAHHCNKTSMQ